MLKHYKLTVLQPNSGYRRQFCIVVDIMISHKIMLSVKACLRHSFESVCKDNSKENMNLALFIDTLNLKGDLLFQLFTS